MIKWLGHLLRKQLFYSMNLAALTGGSNSLWEHQTAKEWPANRICMHWSAPTNVQSLHGFRWTPTVSVSTKRCKSERNALEIPVYAGSGAQLCVQNSFLRSQSTSKVHGVGDSFVLLYEGVIFTAYPRPILWTPQKDQAMCQHRAACQKQYFLIYGLFIMLRLTICIEVMKTSRKTTIRHMKSCSSAVNLTEFLVCVCVCVRAKPVSRDRLLLVSLWVFWSLHEENMLLSNKGKLKVMYKKDICVFNKMKWITESKRLSFTCL